MGFFAKIKAGLTRTKENIGHSIDQLFAGELNDDFYDELEETLILGDMGVDTTLKAVETPAPPGEGGENQGHGVRPGLPAAGAHRDAPGGRAGTSPHHHPPRWPCSSG